VVLPLSREEASLFFRLLVRRYERASLIVTSNKSFADWGEESHFDVVREAMKAEEPALARDAWRVEVLFAR
jgi:DNA replication protein DnaC